MLHLIEQFPSYMTGGGIFATMDGVPWDNSSIDKIALDIDYFGLRSGNKASSPLLVRMASDGRVLSDVEISRLQAVIKNRYLVGWQRIYETLLAEYNPIENYNMVEVETPDIIRQRKTATDLTHETKSATDVKREISADTDITREVKTATDTTDETTASVDRLKETKASSKQQTNTNAQNNIFSFNNVNNPTPVTQSSGDTTTTGEQNDNITAEHETGAANNNKTVTHTTGAEDANKQTERTTGTADANKQTERTTGTADANKQTEHTTGSEDENRTTETEKGTRTLTRSGNIGVTTSAQMAEGEITLRRKYFFDMIFADVDRVLTAPIW